jgi:hypothetical protein
VLREVKIYFMVLRTLTFVHSAEKQTVATATVAVSDHTGEETTAVK